MKLKPHINYLRYVVRHKWYVFKMGRQLNVPLRRLIWHDWTKFLPSEWFPYVRKFYGPNATRTAKGDARSSKGYFHQAGIDEKFDLAWLKHIHRNPHHWQHWLLQQDDGKLIPIDMPYSYICEMVADWWGAGMAQGKPDTVAWYKVNRHKMILSYRTELAVEALVRILPNKALYVKAVRGNSAR